ncbi:response regulator [Luteibacter yeojuensis]|uniref:Response regulator n=1 Tax=Luteibacter yeojuensis TaxID=345309 RepID=A0A7X5TPL8_9GAMM|nr:response regulator [Luteibacter yeojuensis]NID14612.1 response regulator [Luteibacter yeojuensis]
MAAGEAGDRLLIVDDEADVTLLLSRYFSSQGFRVTTACDGHEMRRALAAQPVDLVLLDLGLPDEDGFAITRYLREQWRGPVVIVTGRGEAVDRIVGLELGADDYVTKPFDLRELLARVRSVLRRSRATGNPVSQAPNRLAFDRYVLDVQSHTLVDSEQNPVELTGGEFVLLRTLVEHPNQVMTRDQLMNHVHGREAGPFDRAIDVQVGRLRRKIEPDPSRPRLIKSVRGTGYLFTPTVRRP